MARLILSLLLVSTLAVVWSAPQHYPGLVVSFDADASSSSSSSSSEELHRAVRSPHHDGTDHDHEEKTEHDHEHPVLTGDATKKSNLGGDASTKPRTARDTVKDENEKEHGHTSVASKDKDEDDTHPKHLPIKNGSSLIGGGRTVRDTEQKQSESNLKASIAAAPGPLLLQGAPIHTQIPSAAGDSSEESSEETHKVKRDSPTYPPPPSTSKYGNPLQQPHLDPTPPPGYKPKYRRDTASGSQQAAPAHEGVHGSHATGQERPQTLPVAHPPTSNPQPKTKRDTEQEQPKLGGPLTQTHQDHSKTETDAASKVPTQETPKHKRDTADSKVGAPVSAPPPVHIKTEDGRDATVAVPQIPGAPQSPKPKRDATAQNPQQHSQDDHDHGSHTTANGKPGALTSPQVHETAHKQKRDTTKDKKEETPATLAKETKEEKEKHDKPKRDTYNVDHKQESSAVPLHQQPEKKDEKLSLPSHESEYHRHVRDTEKDSSKSAETHPAESHSSEKHDDKKTSLPEQKKSA